LGRLAEFELKIKTGKMNSDRLDGLRRRSPRVLGAVGVHAQVVRA
jgi:hypothetical protein